MSAPAQNTRLRTFHATMVVTRLEKWSVDAETPEEAWARLAAGEGYRCQLGDCIHVEVQTLDDSD